METSVSVPFWLIDWPSWLSRLIEWLSDCSLQVFPLTLLWKRLLLMSPKQGGGTRQGVALEQISKRDSLDSLLSRNETKRSSSSNWFSNCRRSTCYPGYRRERETKTGRVRERETFACLHGSLLMCCCSVVIYAPARSFDMSKVVSPDWWLLSTHIF